jgi:hypothetical protein
MCGSFESRFKQCDESEMNAVAVQPVVKHRKARKSGVCGIWSDGANRRAQDGANYAPRSRAPGSVQAITTVSGLAEEVPLGLRRGQRPALCRSGGPDGRRSAVRGRSSH